ncbi:RNA polymerase I associated factor, A49-like protein [Caenorhabditis elegans]|uniref:RNA polymerase I associated factor, A49-like protein n=1 Tax=Caenorhabditis elegans TaxID=6239 RepID=Q95X83_CAEEL|nr:RNA polymerase I associated factor, A49-like protein [Caenorhabditis elegans]CCD62359.1 RNA polymerase I associated factor, A49-like protein [Caenorhabditis elegans]|eukprot:NP_001293501.1 RNA POlymerase I (A) subunit [Caenorhabditis elegans]
MWLSSEELSAKKTACHVRNVESNKEFADSDIVASFVHNRPKDLKNLTFERHGKGGRKKAPIFSVKGDISEHVVEVGADVNCLDEGFDFAVALVDKRTGEATYRPARFYSFESKFSEDIEKIFSDKKESSSEEYKNDFSIGAEKWAEKRRQLTSNFGSSKKIKMDEAAQRRTINQETLDEMRKTAFASNSNVKTEDGAADVKLENITMMNKAESSILPPAVQTELSRDIYPISLFLEDIEIDAIESIATELMEKKKKEKLEAGIPECVTLIMYNEKTKQRAAAYLLLSTMIEILTKMGKQRQLLRKDLSELKMPDILRQKVQAQFFNDSTNEKGYTGRGAERIRLNVTDYDRFIAHTLALALTLAPEHKVPITPFQQALSYQPSKLEKMFQALGADLIRLDVASAQTLRSLRAAILLKPPSLEQKGPRKIIRR